MSYQHDDRIYELILSKIDDVAEKVNACHEDVKATNSRLEKHIEDDRVLANEVWFVKRALQVGSVLGGLWLSWKGLIQK